MIYVRQILNEKSHGRRRIDYPNVTRAEYKADDGSVVSVEGKDMLSHSFPAGIPINIFSEFGSHLLLTDGVISINFEDDGE